ncbi:hypothetical protein CNMCM6936_005275 [Aspergillus lentulus]|uniref:MARVEL domain-containing protein n=1 Tax=Aspergillus lentulus TaxID=293939 RepID=A0AAN5YDZ2_ASPLE|nr:hypothetical protein CNMCM6936_005275 [Aspergillus lentulus]KAF4170490.1 hypothetical protein CNMCM8060_005220 [Aspergillus lentulus]KAF4185182.1 hypothetical protein CNMCM7927_006964 [Aspergillus lentulus]KAF4188259.1 hypothetical protein CNMCM8694_004886 [Aspergillus lentulus]KAF4199846.1 hypothetical protein CNMCM8927_004563 [Aspergillus lentulus]
MRSKSVKPSLYPPVPFHTIRAISLLSSVIVGIILAVFISHLKSGGYKLPWAFLLLVVSAFLSILNYIFTSLTHCCYGLSPRLSLLSNTILLILWLISLGLLSWSMSHTILTTCNATYWATSTGITVCRTYKALFTFTCTSTFAAVAAVALDIVIHKRQTRLGEYDPMTSNPDIKLHERNNSAMADTNVSVPLDDERHPLQAQHQHQLHESPYADRHGISDIPGPDYANHPAYRVPPPVYGFNASAEHYHAGEAQEFSETAPARSQRGGPRVRFSGVGRPGYGYPAEQTAYDPGAYR